MEQYDSKLSSVINSTLGMTCRLYGYQYSENLQGRLHVLAGKYHYTHTITKNIVLLFL